LSLFCISSKNISKEKHTRLIIFSFLQTQADEKTSIMSSALSRSEIEKKLADELCKVHNFEPFEYEFPPANPPLAAPPDAMKKLSEMMEMLEIPPGSKDAPSAKDLYTHCKPRAYEVVKLVNRAQPGVFDQLVRTRVRSDKLFALCGSFSDDVYILRTYVNDKCGPDVFDAILVAVDRCCSEKGYVLQMPEIPDEVDKAQYDYDSGSAPEPNYVAHMYEFIQSVEALAFSMHDHHRTACFIKTRHLIHLLNEYQDEIATYSRLLDAKLYIAKRRSHYHERRFHFVQHGFRIYCDKVMKRPSLYNEYLDKLPNRHVCVQERADKRPLSTKARKTPTSKRPRKAKK